MPDAFPLQPAQEIELTIDSLAIGGDGVGRFDGVPVFVPFVCPGERVRVRVTEVRKRHAHAVLEEVLTAAPERVPPPCPVFATCGGCQWQHLDYAAATAAKTRLVADVLARVGKLPDVPVHETIPSPLPYGYRNKLELVAAPRPGGGLDLCFHGVDPDQRVPIQNCLIALPELSVLLEGVTAWLNRTAWPVYDEATSEGLVRTVALRYSATTREANILLTTGRRDLPDKAHQIAALRQELPQIVGVRHVARTRASQTPRGRAVGEMYGHALSIKALGLTLRVSPESFFQVNEALLPTIYERLAAGLDLQPTDHVVDLYGGVGTFGLRLAQEVGHVTLLEIDRNAVHDARGNARAQRAQNFTIIQGQAEQQLMGVHQERRIDTLVLDPPRRGCSPPVLTALARIRPRRVAYLSCDPPTLARDLQQLHTLGLQTIDVQPFDMFPQTAQIEALAILEAR